MELFSTEHFGSADLFVPIIYLVKATQWLHADLPPFPPLLLYCNGPTWGSVLVPTVGIVMAAAALVHQQSTPSTVKKSISTPIGHVVVESQLSSAQLRDYITLPRPRIWWLTKSFRSQFCRCSKHHQPQVMRQHQPGTKSHKTNLFWFNSCWNRFRAGLVWLVCPTSRRHWQSRSVGATVGTSWKSLRNLIEPPTVVWQEFIWK